MKTGLLSAFGLTNIERRTWFQALVSSPSVYIGQLTALFSHPQRMGTKQIDDAKRKFLEVGDSCVEAVDVLWEAEARRGCDGCMQLLES